MITIPTTYNPSTRKFVLDSAIPDNAIRISYGVPLTTIYLPGDTVPVAPEGPSITETHPSDNSKVPQGLVTLVAGAATVHSSDVTERSKIFYNVQIAGGTQGLLRASRVPGVSFTLTSSSGSDTSVIAWRLEN